MADLHTDLQGNPAAQDADEPRTPLWLTLLGGALFFCAGLFLLTQSSQEEASEASAGTEELPADSGEDE